MDVAVLGAGNGGCAVAFDWAAHGHPTRLFALEQFSGEVATVAERGGITALGDLEGFAPVAYAGHDAERAVAGADLVFVVGPAYATDTLAAAAAPHLREGQTVVVCPTSCLGSLAFRRAAGLGLDDDRYLVGETTTVYLKLRAGISVAATPRTQTERLRDLLAEVYPGITSAGSVLATTLQNGNPVIHPAVTITNAARIDQGGDFNFYEDGVTPAVGRLMAAVDRERQAIGAALGHAIPSDPSAGVVQGYMTEANYDRGYSTAPGFRGIRAQSQLDHRYLTEDVGYSLLLFTELARRVDVATPTMDAVIEIASVLLDRDLRAEAPRTLAGLGIGDLTGEQLATL